MVYDATVSDASRHLRPRAAVRQPCTIVDFNDTTRQDQIAISAGGLGGGLTLGMDTSAIFEASGDSQFAAVDSRVHFDIANGTLYFSPDGDIGLGSDAQLQNGATLHPNDLLIVG